MSSLVVWQSVTKVKLHSTGAASRLLAPAARPVHVHAKWPRSYIRSNSTRMLPPRGAGASTPSVRDRFHDRDHYGQVPPKPLRRRIAPRSHTAGPFPRRALHRPGAALRATSLCATLDVHDGLVPSRVILLSAAPSLGPDTGTRVGAVPSRCEETKAGRPVGACNVSTGTCPRSTAYSDPQGNAKASRCVHDVAVTSSVRNSATLASGSSRRARHRDAIQRQVVAL